MEILKNRAVTIAFSLFLMFAIAVSLVALPAANAHTPPWKITTFAFIKVSPNPIGVGQTASVIMWIDKVCYGAAYANDIRHRDYKLTITDPDGVNKTETWDFCVDTTSAQFYGFTPEKVGDYTFTFEFPEQVYTWTEDIPQFFGPPLPNEYTNDTYLGSSATATLTVQDEKVTATLSYPLPQEYWTRPIYGENTDWWGVSSNWLGTGAPGYSGNEGMFYGYLTDSIGPQTSHVMWTKPLQYGGVVGGNQYYVPGDTFFEGSAYINRYTNPIILAGKLYYSEPLGFSSGTGRRYVCVDLHTGEEVWASSTMPTPSFAFIPNVPPANPNQHGVFPPILTATGGGFFGPAGIPAGTWMMFDAYTGDWLYNATNVPSGTTALGPNGEILTYVFQNLGTTSNPNWYLGQWNSTRILYTVAGGFGLSPASAGSIFDASSPSCYDWNVSVSSMNTITSNPTVLVAFHNDIILCREGILPSGGFAFATVSSAPYTYYAINLNSSKGTVGNLLYKETYNPPTGDDNNVTVYDAGCSPESRVFVQSYKETAKWVGFSLDTGKKLWGPTASQIDNNPLDYFGNQFSGTSTAQLAYGNVYTSEFGGILYCYDAKTGDLKWTYGNGGEGNSTDAGYNAPRGNYPTMIATIGNGIIYLETTEHTVTTPIYKGARTRAINATDGTEVWTLSAYIGGGAAGSSYAIADGFATWFNGYDNQIYTVGRGPSATTVTASPKVSVNGDTVLVEGSVIDIAAGTLQDEQAARFPKGVPAVSDESMSDWMEYVYMQRPRPSDVVGVEVVISVLDPNNNCYEVARATSESNGYFKAEFIPEVPGEYFVYATFEGSKSYWSSHDVTAITVKDAPQATPVATPVPQEPVGTYFTVSTVLIIVAIAIVAFLLLRRR